MLVCVFLLQVKKERRNARSVPTDQAFNELMGDLERVPSKLPSKLPSKVPRIKSVVSVKPPNLSPSIQNQPFNIHPPTAKQLSSTNKKSSCHSDLSLSNLHALKKQTSSTPKKSFLENNSSLSNPHACQKSFTSNKLSSNNRSSLSNQHALKTSLVPLSNQHAFEKPASSKETPLRTEQPVNKKLFSQNQSSTNQASFDTNINRTNNKSKTIPLTNKSKTIPLTNKSKTPLPTNKFVTTPYTNNKSKTSPLTNNKSKTTLPTNNQSRNEHFVRSALIHSDSSSTKIPPNNSCQAQQLSIYQNGPEATTFQKLVLELLQ